MSTIKLLNHTLYRPWKQKKYSIGNCTMSDYTTRFDDITLGSDDTTLGSDDITLG